MLSIIIVNYRTPALLRQCLSSIMRQRMKIPYEVIVVDNCSGDSSYDSFKEIKGNNLRWFSLHANVGFARANNFGIKQASGDVVLLLNSDTIVSDNVIEKCYTDFIKSEYAACGIQLIDLHGRDQISGNYIMRGGLNYLLKLPIIAPMMRVLGKTLKIEKPHLTSGTNKPAVVDWICGAFLMTRKETAFESGMLDNDFFLYAEDAEWCSRLREIGDLAIFPQYKITHLEGKSSSDQKLKNKQLILSNFVRFRKEFGLYWFLFHAVMYSIFLPKVTFPLWRYFPKIILSKPYFYKLKAY